MNEMWRIMSQKYVPRVNDYVKWDHLEGWIYWIDDTGKYLTLEIMVRKKSEESYKDCALHRNERCLVCVFPEDWNRLVYVRSRKYGIIDG